ncbi:MAG: (2Fe-2S)-binding protein [Planctomycetes bacterium]|nr:(2Fe-2S)-binding protein [Planctomycetota bacterium]
MRQDPNHDEENAERADLSRRLFLRNAGTVAAGSVLAQGLLGACASERASAAAAPAAPAKPDGAPEELAGEFEIVLDVNGEARKVKVEPRTTLLAALRERMEPAMTGTKHVCDRGNCGACTVHVDGKPAYACLLLAADLRGRKIKTIEGLGAPESLSPLQENFCAHDASMCGFCTPGFVMSITACLEKQPNADLATIQKACSGNVCRCGTYPHVFAAALATAKQAKKG